MPHSAPYNNNSCPTLPYRRKLYLFLILLLAVSYAGRLTAGEGSWPKQLDTAKGRITLYQPQPESYDLQAGTIAARAAFSFTQTGSTKPEFGAMLFTARYGIDREADLAQLQSITIKEWKFPGADATEKTQLQDYLNQLISQKPLQTSLSELTQSLKGIKHNQQDTTKLANTPPQIYYREEPTALVIIDGKPIPKDIPDTDYQRIINTPYMLLYAKASGRYYLNGNNQWFSSKSITGEWSPAANLPAGLKETAKAQGLEDIAPSDTTNSITPRILVCTEPAELIAVDGRPEYLPLNNAGILYIKNTSSVLLLNISQQQYYTLAAGRWYTSSSLEDGAKWSYVPSSEVPQDFTKIPATEQTAGLLAAVPGTEQAEQAVLEATIPQTAEVQRDAPTPEISYDGAPEFAASGAAGVEYGVNTAAAVIKYGSTYYLCDSGVWYSSKSPTGSWSVCTEIPEAVYTIPPSCPLYNTTYVRIYDYTPDVVYVGYTPGYLGSYIYNGVVVFGTGYYYRPWYRRYFFPRPITWGFGARYNPITGVWGFAIGYRPIFGGGGFYFGLGFGGGWYGRGWNGWWGRGGYHDHNITINNQINIRHNNFGNNIYQDNKFVKTLQQRRDTLSPEQREKAAQRLKNNHAQLSSADKADRRDNIKERLNADARPELEHNKAKVEDRLKNTQAGTKLQERITSSAELNSDNRLQEWQNSERSNNIFTDREGNIFRSNPATNDWQRLQNNGDWRNSGLDTDRARELNRARENRVSGLNQSRENLRSGGGFDRARAGNFQQREGGMHRGGSGRSFRR